MSVRRKQLTSTAMKGSQGEGQFSNLHEEKTKDAVTCCSWWWDIAIFCHLGWDDQHLLPYVFQSLQGFLGDLARSLGEEATLNDILQKLDEYYGVVMMFDTLSKALYSLKQGSGENMAKLECPCCSRSRYSSWSIQEGSNRNT